MTHARAHRDASLRGLEAEQADQGAYNMKGEHSLDWGAVMAAATIIALPMLVFTLLVQKHIVPILLTPFDEQERVDEESLRGEVAFLIDAGVHGLGLALGSEILNLTDAERQQLISVVVDEARGRVPVVVNTGAQANRARCGSNREHCLHLGQGRQSEHVRGALSYLGYLPVRLRSRFRQRQAGRSGLPRARLCRP